MAHGRLGDAQALRRARDRAFLVHREQQAQQVAVQVQMIEFAHGWHEYVGLYRRVDCRNTAQAGLERTRLIQIKHLPNRPIQETFMCTPDIPGTTLFDGRQARKGYALNKMCFSFNEAEQPRGLRARRGRLLRKLRPQRGAARRRSRSRNVLQLIEAGGNVYYLAKFAGIFGLDVQDIGAQQTGMSRSSVQGEARRAAGR